MQELVPHMSCVCNPLELEQALAAGYKQIFILSAQGIFKHHVLRGEGRYVRVKVDSIPGYIEPSMTQSMNFLPAGPIPYEIYEQVLAFFRKVMEVKTAELEAMIHVLWNAERGYHLGVPPQTISKASVNYDWGYIPEGTNIIVDIHSHNTMGAFFSGTDNSDDRNNISFSGVFGKLKDKEPMTVWRFNYYDRKFDVKPENLFAMPTVPEVEVPQEWLDQVNVRTYGPYQGTYKGPQGDQGNAHGPTAGRNYDHLKPYQFQKSPLSLTNNGSNSPNNESSKNDNVGPVANRNKPERDYPDFVDGDFGHGFGGDQGTFFGHSSDNEGPTVEEYYHRKGIQEVNPNKEFSVPGDKFSKFVYDAERNLYVVRSSDGKAIEEPEDKNQGDKTFTNVTEDPTSSSPKIWLPQHGTPSAEEESHLGKTQVETENSNSAQEQNGNLRSSIPGGNNEYYEYIHSVHGADVADAWHDIDMAMVWLDGKDTINSGLISEMFNFISEDGQSKLIKTLFEQLSPRQREKIEQNGI